jgi:hypothetical protein
MEISPARSGYHVEYWFVYPLALTTGGEVERRRCQIILYPFLWEATPFFWGLKMAMKERVKGAWSSGWSWGLAGRLLRFTIYLLFCLWGCPGDMYYSVFADAPEMEGWFCSLNFSVVLPCICLLRRHQIDFAVYTSLLSYLPNLILQAMLYRTRSWPQTL